MKEHTQFKLGSLPVISNIELNKFIKKLNLSQILSSLNQSLHDFFYSYWYGHIHYNNLEKKKKHIWVISLL